MSKEYDEFDMMCMMGDKHKQSAVNKVPASTVAKRRKIETDSDSDISIKSSTSSNSSNVSDLKRLQSKYATKTGVLIPTSDTIKRKTKAADSLVDTTNTKTTDKPKTSAAQKKKLLADELSKPEIPVSAKKAAATKKLMEELSKKCSAAALGTATQPLTVQEKARRQREKKKLLAEQKRSEHESFLMEAMGVPITETTTRQSAVKKQIQAMLNKLFGSQGDYVPPMSESFGPVVSRERLKRGATKN